MTFNSISLAFFIGFASFSTLGVADDLNEARKALIGTVLKVDPKNVRIQRGIGKVDASDEFKTSYFIQTTEHQKANSRITIIPMATSRYDKYNYHTDDWWEKYGADAAAGKTVPPEDPEVVGEFLDKHGLSTNPDVFVIDGVEDKQPKRIKLQEFLTQNFIEKYGDDQFVYLFRGAAKSSELGDWRASAGRFGEFPKGVRYWTPDVTYAWRYARKRETFLADTLSGNSPLLQFKIPRDDFLTMVKKGQLVLGTELPKSVHNGFESSGRFKDVLFSETEYLGEGRYGVEYEIRANRAARNVMSKYFEGPVSMETLGNLRMAQLELAFNRIVKNEPERAQLMNELLNKKRTNIEIEKKMALAAQNKDAAAVAELQSKLMGRDISNSDFENLATAALKQVESAKAAGNMAPTIPMPDCKKVTTQKLFF